MSLRKESGKQQTDGFFFHKICCNFYRIIFLGVFVYYEIFAALNNMNSEKRRNDNSHLRFAVEEKHINGLVDGMSTSSAFFIDWNAFHYFYRIWKCTSKNFRKEVKVCGKNENRNNTLERILMYGCLVCAMQNVIDEASHNIQDSTGKWFRFCLCQSYKWTCYRKQSGPFPVLVK